MGPACCVLTSTNFPSFRPSFRELSLSHARRDNAAIHDVDGLLSPPSDACDEARVDENAADQSTILRCQLVARQLPSKTGLETLA
jgi:hypothetical protein